MRRRARAPAARRCERDLLRVEADGGRAALRVHLRDGRGRHLPRGLLPRPGTPPPPRRACSWCAAFGSALVGGPFAAGAHAARARCTSPPTARSGRTGATSPSPAGADAGHRARLPRVRPLRRAAGLLPRGRGDRLASGQLALAIPRLLRRRAVAAAPRAGRGGPRALIEGDRPPVHRRRRPLPGGAHRPRRDRAPGRDHRAVIRRDTLLRDAAQPRGHQRRRPEADPQRGRLPPPARGEPLLRRRRDGRPRLRRGRRRASPSRRWPSSSGRPGATRRRPGRTRWTRRAATTRTGSSPA